MLALASNHDPSVMPMWLTREEDVLSHLFYAAAEIGSCEIDYMGKVLAGAISFPNAETNTFSVFINDGLDPSQALPTAGMVMRLRYSRGDSHYSFLTAIADPDDGQRWRLSFPRTIERNERRIVDRHRMGARKGFRIRLEGSDGERQSLNLFDLSTAGLSFSYGKDKLSVEVGAAFAGTLCTPAGDTLPVLVEVRNNRPKPGQEGAFIAGCRFIGLASRDHANLARALAEWSRGR